ncbi:hypothetical protein A0256_23150 [Mucilaginibacter sp. PAMC 26640]|nr:hypothetical protein A0256_23150 [Mucilaginibacter sp. PAMC 26640]
MTIKEALTTKTASLSISSAVLDLAIIEAGLIGISDYDPTDNGKAVDLVWAGLLLTTIQVTEQKEDDVSVKFSTDLKGIYSWIMRKWGLLDPFAPVKPTVRQVNFW